MRRLLLPLFLCALSMPVAAQTPSAERTVDIREVSVWGRRPMKRIGTERTDLDSSALRQNIALSVADVLTYRTPVFVKQYGRATLSTVSVRGTGPSHTQVTWNGMRIGNPMLGMADFSMIPAYFVDEASLLYGSSSLQETGGGLGGLVRLATRPARTEGFGMEYVQGVGMFRTFDEYLRLAWGDSRWQLSTRLFAQSSANDYKYRNRDKMEHIYDEQMNIVGSYHPVERNRSGSFADLHLLQEVYFRTRGGDRLGLNAWYLHSDRELPLLTTDYADETRFENRQRERTFRGVASWDRTRSDHRIGVRAGYVHTWLAYDYRRDPGNGIMSSMTRSRSRVNTLYGQADGEYAPHERWLFSASLAVHQHLVESADRSILLQEGGSATVGYDQGRVELEGSLSARWRPFDRLGLSLVLRESLFGREWSPLIPALFAEYLLSGRGEVVLRASASRNYRFPTLNDLYFMPGGNPDLRSERGYGYEAGLSFEAWRDRRCSLSGSVSWYDQHIDDWILWLPTTKGFFSPVNVKRVHAYGAEVQADFTAELARDWRLELHGTFSWAPSVNTGEPMSPADRSVGRQLPYEPLYSAAVTGRLEWRTWSLVYRWNYYSERYTMSSNDVTLTGTLPDYFMNGLSLEKRFVLPRAELSLKGTVDNLFDEEYLSVLSRPMPGIHAEFFFGIRPRWGHSAGRR